MSNEVVVSAAMLSPCGVVIPCVRHSDELFYHVVKVMFPELKHYHNFDQGFVTNKFRYVARGEAWVIAKESDQLIRDEVWNHTSRGDILYSENLY